jgi:hypothetical protein
MQKRRHRKKSLVIPAVSQMPIFFGVDIGISSQNNDYRSLFTLKSCKNFLEKQGEQH